MIALLILIADLKSPVNLIGLFLYLFGIIET